MVEEAQDNTTIDLGSIGGTTTFTNVLIDSEGSVTAAPAFTWSNDSNTGMWRTSTDTIRFSVDHTIELSHLQDSYVLDNITRQELVRRFSEMDIDQLSQCEILEEWEQYKAKVYDAIKNDLVLPQKPPTKYTITIQE